MRTLLPILLLAACSVPDGDLAAVPALVRLDATADESDLAARSTRVSGEVTLGYTSPELVALAIRDNETLVWTGSLEAKALTLPFEATVATLVEGDNTLVVEAAYLGDTVSTSTAVDVPDGVLALSVATPPAPDVLETTVEGVYTLGFTSDTPAALTITVEGVVAAADDLDPVAGDGSFALPITLPHAGPVDVVVDLRYGETARSSSIVVGVPTAIDAWTVTAPAASDVLSAHVTGTLQAGWRSDAPAAVEVSVDGQVMATTSLDLSAGTSADLSLDVPLLHAGANEVVTRVTYGGETASASATVTVVPPAPAVTLPGWGIDYQPGVSLTASGDVAVTPPAGWDVVAVRGSMDGGLTWLAATEPGHGLSFPNPDVAQAVLVEVVTANRGIEQTWRWSDTLPVEVIFDCQDPGAMQPSNDLIRDMRTEYRTMTGYFGDPLGPHTVSFVIDSDTEFGYRPTVGNPLQRGAFAIDVAFNVDLYRCNQQSNCSQPYDLEVLVDGASFCQNTGYGDIYEQNN